MKLKKGMCSKIRLIKTKRNNCKPIRSKRYITTSQGVPIIDESYAEQKKNKTSDEINKLLSRNRNSQPKLNYDWDEKK